MKNIEYIVIVSLFLTFGCENILEPEIQGQVALEELLSTESGLITAVNAIYQPLLSEYGTRIPTLTAMASDNAFTWRKETEPDIYNIDPTYSSTQSLWTGHYNGITRANTVLAKMQLIEEFSSTEMKDAIEGQAKFLRAFYYFNLVRFFGDVPQITDEIKTREDAEQPRASIENIYTLIKSDLDDAISLLPTSYSGATGLEVGRPTTYAASALKAMVLLELEEWSAAAQAANAVVGKGQLLANYADNFNGSNENGVGSLFEVQYGGSVGSTTTSISDGNAPPEYNGGGSPLPSDDDYNGEGGGLSSGNGFVQCFEPNDLRKSATITNYDIPNFIQPSKPNGTMYYISKFYNVTDPEGLSTWNYPVIRYADILLIRAEALNEVGYSANSEAFTMLNQIRINAGLDALTSTDLPDQTAFRTAVRQERRVEFGFESKRYFDLNRWGILKETIQFQMDYTGLTFPADRLIDHPVTGEKYFLYPIPTIEFVNNANLGEQNPGY
jgi:hypothetical protein